MLLLVSGQVGYSPHHFLRLFWAVTGETPGAYIRNRRLAEAARLLAEREDRILDIALEYQYQSQAALTRSFKRATGVTPGQYRRARRVLEPDDQPRLARPTSGVIPGGVDMDPRFEERGKMMVVGMIYYGENKNNEIAGLWQRFNPRCPAIPNVKDGSGAYGVCFNDTRTEDPNFCYLACLEVADLNDVPMDMVAKTLPASAYAVFTHRGFLGKLAATYEGIYRTWLPNSDYTLAGSYDFESYPESFDLEDEARCVLEIWVPVKKKG
jgi:AraC family transcriptional regulator